MIMDNNNNTYYCCQYYFFKNELILCAECDTWANDVEETIEKHRNDFKPVLNVKRWKNNKNNKNQKNSYV